MSKYVITHDGQVLHDSSADDERLRVLDPVYKPGMGLAGELDFSISPGHPAYNAINKFSSEITLFIDDEWEWSGRVLNDNRNFANIKDIEVEGELTYLNDSLVKPYEYESGSISDYFGTLLSRHNTQVEDAKKFTKGTVTVTNSTDNVVRGSSSFPTTWGEMSEKLTGNEGLGGFLRTRHYQGQKYLDYIENYASINSQIIRFGENLLDMSRFVKGEDIITALIPQGATIEGEETETGGQVRLDIKSVNNGSDSIFDQEAVDLYGWVWGYQTWDDVTEPLNLKQKGFDYLAEQRLLGITLEVNAIDMSLINVDLERIRIGDLIQVISEPHGVNEFLTVNKMSVDLADPAGTTMELGVNRKELTDEIGKDIRNATEKIVANYVTNERLVDKLGDVVTTVTQEYSSLINQTAQDITLEVASTYATKSALASEKTERQSQLTQTVDDINIEFNRVDTSISTVDGVAQDSRTKLNTYFNFSLDGMEIGKDDSPFKINIDNSEIGFFQNGNKAAYITNNKLYMPGGDITGGTINAGEITGATVQSSSSIYGSGPGGWRMTINPDGSGLIDVTDLSGSRVFRAGATGTEITGRLNTRTSGARVTIEDDGEGGRLNFIKGSHQGRIKILPNADRIEMVYNDYSDPNQERPNVGVEQNLVSMRYRTMSIRLGGTSGSDQYMRFEGRADFLNGLSVRTGSRASFTTSDNTIVGYVGQRPESGGSADFEVRARIGPVRLTGESIDAFAVYNRTVTFGSNVFVTEAGGLRRSSSASRYKVDKKEMEIPDSILDIPFTDWVDKSSLEELEKLEKLPRPMTEAKQREFDAVNLRRIPGVVAEDVLEHGGEPFVIFGADGQTEQVMYDRIWGAQIQVETRQRRAETESLRAKNAKLEERISQLEELWNSTSQKQ